jgi:hypothetical protein
VVATVTNTQSVCDVCQNPRRKVKTFRVGWDGQNVRVDLCREHGEPLEQMLKIGDTIASASPRARVWTMEEIEKEKRRAKGKRPPTP